MSVTMAGALLGLPAAAGLLIVAARVRAIREPLFDRRVAPYVRDVERPSGLLAVSATAPVSRVHDFLQSALGSLSRAAVRRLDDVLGGRASLRRRVEFLGDETADSVRMDQVVWGGTGLAAVLGLGVLRAALGLGVAPLPWFLLTIAGGTAGVLARDRALTRRVAVRKARVLAEFPAVAELLALAVAAGQGPTGALERVGNLCRGELGGELRRTLADARSGAGLVRALQAFADRSAEPVVRRFVDGVVVAVERGTPLADLLRAQAIDVRESGRRALIETAARKEVAMMVPVVFLVLPLSVVFALFPGFYGLNLSVT